MPTLKTDTVTASSLFDLTVWVRFLTTLEYKGGHRIASTAADDREG